LQYRNARKCVYCISGAASSGDGRYRVFEAEDWVEEVVTTASPDVGVVFREMYE